VLVNGAEGEPLSWKDQTLMAARPHLVLDGAFLAAETLGAPQVVVYVGEHQTAARAALRRAVLERPTVEGRMVRVVSAPARYVAGEESAAVHFVNEGLALPTTVPPRPFERGVAGRATLVQNVETLAHIALIARFGPAATTSLVTVSGAVRAAGVLEVGPETTVGEVIMAGGGIQSEVRAVLVGGYFGTWLDVEAAWSLPVDPEALREHDLALGCGVIAPLAASACAACETARIMRYLAGESSAQCGPCYFGLRSLADTLDRIVDGRGSREDLEQLSRWSAQVRGRGACRHPDGASQMLRSALRLFNHELGRHLTQRGAHVA
jgi:NADH:ubiquinone oxidoreductase subunit F (NADH-binding)